MLEFIVLGLVPGTHIQITFGLLAATVLPIAAVLGLASYGKRLRTLIQRKLGRLDSEEIVI